MSPERVDLAIVGAGPAGSAAAITAVESGLSVSVIDKVGFPRDKTCGDGLTTGALRRLETLGIEPDDIPSWNVVHDVVLSDPKGRTRRFPLPRGRGQFAAIARRRELDHELVRRARTVGATVHEHTELGAIEPLDDRVVLTTTGDGPERIEARYVLAADGMWSPTRRLLGLDIGTYKGEWHAFRQYATGALPSAARDLWVWFEEDLLPGYVWAFPLADGTLNIGYGVMRTTDLTGKQLAGTWRELLQRPNVAAALGPDVAWEGPARAWPIPARLGRLPRHHGRVLFVGDAAGATDPMTGEGIGQALETGMLAVEELLAAGPERPELAGARYARALDRTMVKDHALAGALGRVLASPVGATASMAAAGATDWTRRNFARWLFEDYPRAVLATPSRWRRDVFDAAGAYDRRLY